MSTALFGSCTPKQQHFYLRLLLKSMQLLINKVVSFHLQEETPEDAEKFNKYMNRIFKYLKVIEDTKRIQLKFSEQLSPLEPFIQKEKYANQNTETNTFETMSQISGVQSMKSIMTKTMGRPRSKEPILKSTFHNTQSNFSKKTV